MGSVLNQSVDIGLEPTAPSRAGWVNAVLMPVKQHIGCCVVLPLAANAMGGGAAAWLATPQAELALFAVVPPLVTYVVMKAEELIAQRSAKKTSEPTCECAHHATSLTGKNFLNQTAIAYAFYAAAHLLMHDLRPHEHGKQDDHVVKRAVGISLN